jgi:MarR family 2-MHQ and catechol resistance regulon transcriptional repressor
MKVRARPQHDGRRGEAYVRRTARDFADRFPWADLTALEITNALNACYNSQRAALGKTFEELGFGKALGRSTLLRALHFAGRPLTHNEIGYELEVTPGSVTYLVDGLEKEGLARRIIDPSDRRTVYVELTTKGEEVSERLTPAVADLTGRLCEVFSEDEKREFLSLLLRFLDSAREHYVDKAPGESEAALVSESAG